MKKKNPVRFCAWCKLPYEAVKKSPVATLAKTLTKVSGLRWELRAKNKNIKRKITARKKGIPGSPWRHHEDGIHVPDRLTHTIMSETVNKSLIKESHCNWKTKYGFFIEWGSTCRTADYLIPSLKWALYTLRCRLVSCTYTPQSIRARKFKY